MKADLSQLRVLLLTHNFRPYKDSDKWLKTYNNYITYVDIRNKTAEVKHSASSISDNFTWTDSMEQDIDVLWTNLKDFLQKKSMLIKER